MREGDGEAWVRSNRLQKTGKSGCEESETMKVHKGKTKPDKFD